MPADPTEIVTLSAEAIALGQSIGEAVGKDSPGGRKITKAEAVAILKRAAELVAHLARDLAD